MDSLALYQKLSQYEALKEDLAVYLRNLKQALPSLRAASRNIEHFYTYNSEGADNNQILTEYNKVKKIVSSIEGEVFNQIDNKIRTLKKMIAEEQATRIIQSIRFM